LDPAKLGIALLKKTSGFKTGALSLLLALSLALPAVNLAILPAFAVPSGEIEMDEDESDSSQTESGSAESREVNVDDEPPAAKKPAYRKPVQPGESAMITSKSAYADIAGPPSSMTLKAGASYTVPKGTGISLKVLTVPTHGMKLLDKDMDGNPTPAKYGDVISARITEDIFVDGDSVIPEGTIFRGHVVNINGPRRVQRPGWVDISFNELELPNGRIFRFAAAADNFEKSTAKSKLKGVGMVSANAAGGAIVGAMFAYYIFGMHNTIAMHGYNIAGGAAAGAILAAGHAVMKRGHKAWLEPGDALNLTIDTDMVMPALTAPTRHVAEKNYYESLKFEILKSKIVKSGLSGGHFVRMDVNIFNGTRHDLSSLDLYLRDTTGTKCPLTMGPEDDNRSEFHFTLRPEESVRTRLYFDTEHPKLGHDLIWFDHNTHEVCFKQKLQIQS
jgi:hypothetical protein